jgi:hypothetical protein
MENFYLAYIVNGLIGLFIGYVWGVYDGYRIGAQKRQNARRTTETAQRDNDPSER